MPPRKLITVYNGIDTGQFKISAAETAAVRRELDLSPGQLAVGTMGELTQQKGYRYLLEAIPEILKSVPSVKFFIAGEGELKKSLLVLRDKLGLQSSVSFLGFRDDVPRLLSAFDIFVLPSLWEGLPVALIEAMAAGKPIVATDVDGNCEVTGRDAAGIAVEPLDPPALATALLELLGDPELRRRLGDAGIERAQKLFDVRIMIKRYQDLYEACL
jgi:glycosyltransferase involved in cell wall biosynthesis